MLSLNVVKAWMKVTVNTYDDQIQELMVRAQAIIERETGWYFGPPRETEEVLDGTGTAKLFLRQPPVDPSELRMYARPAATDEWTEIQTTLYELEGRGVYVPTRWLKGLRNFRATYREGFTDPPGDVAQLFLDLVTAKWKGRGDRTDLVSETIGDYSYTRADLEQQDSWVTVRNNWGRKRIA